MTLHRQNRLSSWSRLNASPSYYALPPPVRNPKQPRCFPQPGLVAAFLSRLITSPRRCAPCVVSSVHCGGAGASRLDLTHAPRETKKQTEPNPPKKSRARACDPKYTPKFTLFDFIGYAAYFAIIFWLWGVLA